MVRSRTGSAAAISSEFRPGFPGGVPDAPISADAHRLLFLFWDSGFYGIQSA